MKFGLVEKDINVRKDIQLEKLDWQKIKTSRKVGRAEKAEV